MTDRLATGIGLARGLLACYWTGQLTLPRLLARSRNPELFVKLSLGGTVIAALPALALSIVVGATLGMPWGASGMVAGVALVFALVLLAGTFVGVLLSYYLK